MRADPEARYPAGTRQGRQPAPGHPGGSRHAGAGADGDERGGPGVDARAGVSVAEQASSGRLRGRLRWWKEVLVIAIFYGVYSAIRNTQGSATVSNHLAFRNARWIIRAEQALGLYHERGIQQAFVGNHAVMSLWNLFYGTFHFFVTGIVLLVLFNRFPERYPQWRNVLAATTALALVGFATYPLMPPRLLPASYGFVDSLKAFGSLWSFDSAAMQKISNQFAAMPSLHFAWASWSACALVPALRRWWTKALALLYPVLTLVAIVVTANHFLLDAAGGAVVLGGGCLFGLAVRHWWPGGLPPGPRRRPRAADVATAP